MRNPEVDAWFATYDNPQKDPRPKQQAMDGPVRGFRRVVALHARCGLPFAGKTGTSNIGELRVWYSTAKVST